MRAARQKGHNVTFPLRNHTMTQRRHLLRITHSGFVSVTVHRGGHLKCSKCWRCHLRWAHETLRPWLLPFNGPHLNWEKSITLPKRVAFQSPPDYCFCPGSAPSDSPSGCVTVGRTSESEGLPNVCLCICAPSYPVEFKWKNMYAQDDARRCACLQMLPSWEQTQQDFKLKSNWKRRAWERNTISIWWRWKVKSYSQFKAVGQLWSRPLCLEKSGFWISIF